MKSDTIFDGKSERFMWKTLRRRAVVDSNDCNETLAKQPSKKSFGFIKRLCAKWMHKKRRNGTSESKTVCKALDENTPCETPSTVVSVSTNGLQIAYPKLRSNVEAANLLLQFVLSYKTVLTTNQYNLVLKQLIDWMQTLNSVPLWITIRSYHTSQELECPTQQSQSILILLNVRYPLLVFDQEHPLECVNLSSSVEYEELKLKTLDLDFDMVSDDALEACCSSTFVRGRATHYCKEFDEALSLEQEVLELLQRLMQREELSEITTLDTLAKRKKEKQQLKFDNNMPMQLNHDILKYHAGSLCWHNKKTKRDKNFEFKETSWDQMIIC